MNIFFSYALAFLFIFSALSSKVHGFKYESILDKSQTLIANKYAERFCSAKADHFFEGLDNEKTLKYSYFQYTRFDEWWDFLKGMYKPLINQIREKCLISNYEERELNELFTKKP